jgi:hypothetical protein
MPHISLDATLPGIRGPMAFRPDTAKPINELADVLLRGPSTLAPGERELIAICLCNRYVDGLATWAPSDPDFYRQRAAIVATLGYAGATPQPVTRS